LSKQRGKVDGQMGELEEQLKREFLFISAISTFHISKLLNSISRRAKSAYQN
jgi:hypothetical protein